jgi:hypothetical protein
MLSESEQAGAMVGRLVRMKRMPELHTLHITNECDGFVLRGQRIWFDPNVLDEIYRTARSMRTGR